ncbi:hypothetical protein GCM10010388_02760 [Streptomyces mauvecolor]
MGSRQSCRQPGLGVHSAKDNPARGAGNCASNHARSAAERTPPGGFREGVGWGQNRPAPAHPCLPVRGTLLPRTRGTGASGQRKGARGPTTPSPRFRSDRKG